jgi:hypothetical protein
MRRAVKSHTTRVFVHPQPPFGTIGYVAIAVLLLGILWMVSHLGMNVYCTLHGVPTEGPFQQIFNLFTFAVVECFALILLKACGQLPFLPDGLLKELVKYTIGNIPKLLALIIKQFTKLAINQTNNSSPGDAVTPVGRI